MRKVYFDYAASTPVDENVFEAMRPFFSEEFGNPGALHQSGQRASAAIFTARRALATSINAQYKEVIFTGSATEANNLALRGVVKTFQNQPKTKNFPPKVDQPWAEKLKARIIISAFEHESILATAEALEREDVEVVRIPVSREGLVDIGKLRASLNDQTVLVSIMYANNEVGTIQPIAKIADIVRNFRNSKSQILNSSAKGGSLPTGQAGASGGKNFIGYPLLHTDAVQAFQYLDCNVSALGVDLMTLSAHKIYGPKGVGALFVRNALTANGYTLYPIITGGGQEFGLRSGTENVAGIVGFGKAAEIAMAIKEKEIRRVVNLRDYFWKSLRTILRGATLNGSFKKRLPNNLNIYFPSHLATDLLITLDLSGVASSPGSACRARAVEPSYVLKAMGFSDRRALHSLRFSFGRPTEKSDIDYALGIFKKIVKR